MPLPESIIVCDSAGINPTDPLCTKLQGAFDGPTNFCTFRNWAFNVAGTDITVEFENMIFGPAGGDMTGSSWPNLIIAPGVVTSAKMTTTGVTPGTYSNVTFTVDIAGRITAITQNAATIGNSSQVTGSGSNYQHNNGITWTNVTFGVTDPVIVIPDAGTYLITALIGGTNITALKTVHGRLFNITGAAAVANSARNIHAPTLGGFQLVLSNIVTIGASSVTIQVSSTDGTDVIFVEPAITSISYVRLA